MHALKTNEKVFSKQLARLVQTSTPVASLYHKNKLGNIFFNGEGIDQWRNNASWLFYSGHLISKKAVRSVC